MTYLSFNRENELSVSTSEVGVAPMAIMLRDRVILNPLVVYFPFAETKEYSK